LQLREEAAKAQQTITELEKKIQETEEMWRGESAELVETKAQMKSYLSRKETLTQQNKEIHEEIQIIEELLRERQNEFDRIGDGLKFHSTLDVDEIRAFESLSGLRVAIVNSDAVQFIFTLIDRSSPSREYSITLDLASGKYGIIDCVPLVDATQLKTALDELNSTGRLVVFLRDLRQLFKDSEPV
jgi:hypothetical protein